MYFSKRKNLELVTKEMLELTLLIFGSQGLLATDA